MNKIIPFKKNIILDNLKEITSISLEHTLSIKDADTIEGDFIISGEYKTNEETKSFDNKLPFKAFIDDKYILDKATIDIDDFYYEVINENKLSVNIDVKVDNIEEKEITLEEKEWENHTLPIEERCIEEETKEEVKETKKEVKEENSHYKSYTVYIVREQDTIDTIMTKYNVSKEIISMYNNLDDIKIGDKIIVPV